MRRGVLLMLLVGFGCRGHGARGTESACQPVEGALPDGSRVEGLIGEFRLTLVEGAGAGGRQTAGLLTLWPQADSLVSVPGYPADVSTPLIGSATLDLDAVGAALVGSLESRDPIAPGVLVVRRPHDVTLRLGADANRRGEVRFDGAFAALFVQKITASGFRGSWRSGGAEHVAEGYFCAVREGEGDG